VDDERLRRQLSAADGPAQPSRAFAAELKATLLAELQLTDVGTPVPAHVATRRREGRVPGWWMAAAALIAVAIAGATFGAGAIVRWLDDRPAEVAIPAKPGVLRVAVRPDDPQVLAPGSGFGGFDVDVAEEIGRRLGLRVQLVIESPEEMLAERDEWDIALPSESLPVESTRGLAASSPYYHWPVFVVTSSGGATGIADLVGSTICVAAGSTAEAWLEDREGRAVDRRVAPPADVVVRRAADDDACLRELRDGISDAAATSRMLEGDVDSEAGVGVVGGGPVASEPRSMLIATGEAGDVLRAAIDDALAGAFEDGTLAQLSARRFGGADLTVAPQP